MTENPAIFVTPVLDLAARHRFGKHKPFKALDIHNTSLILVPIIL